MKYELDIQYFAGDNGDLGSYGISAGTKLAWGELGQDGAFPSTYEDLLGCTQIPDLGSAPENVDSTTLDNLKYRTGVPGLIDLGSLDFPFNLETPSAAANINTIAGLDEDTVYAWRVTYASGITVQIKSRARYHFNAVGVNEIESFTLTLTPEDGLTINVPNGGV